MPIRKKDAKLIAAGVAALLFIAARFFPYAATALAKDDSLYVKRVVDGDTLKLSDNSRVRLIGVDTPEVYYSDKLVRDAYRSGKDINQIQALGRKASEFTKKLCEGKKIRLEFDVEKRDRYRRLLAYVYLEDGTFVNAKILEEGFGQVMTIPPDIKYADKFLSLEKEARQARKGLWNE